VFGFNGLPGMLNRTIFEVSVLRPEHTATLKDWCEKLKTDYSVVDDRVGLVTPRVIAMIINEAYYTVQEGTASRADIDLAMKLGTNYPHGPFEWCQKIGIRHIYELLDAVYQDTKDERYKICPLLKKEYLEAASARL
jgi:3-hydroxybutyryl-CoA dehydrogenase